jgi:hypothetical protein
MSSGGQFGLAAQSTGQTLCAASLGRGTYVWRWIAPVAPQILLQVVLRDIGQLTDFQPHNGAAASYPDSACRSGGVQLS